MSQPDRRHILSPREVDSRHVGGHSLDGAIRRWIVWTLSITLFWSALGRTAVGMIFPVPSDHSHGHVYEIHTQYINLWHIHMETLVPDNHQPHP